MPRLWWSTFLETKLSWIDPSIQGSSIFHPSVSRHPQGIRILVEAFTKQIPWQGGGRERKVSVRQRILYVASRQNPYVSGGNLKGWFNQDAFCVKSSLLKEKLGGVKCCGSAIFFPLIGGWFIGSISCCYPCCSSFLYCVLDRC